MNIYDECIKKMCYLINILLFHIKKGISSFFDAIDNIRRQCAK